MNIELLMKKIKSVSRDSLKITKSMSAIDKHQSNYKAHYAEINKHLQTAKNSAIDPREISSVFTELSSWIETVEKELARAKAEMIKAYAKELNALYGSESGSLRKWADGFAVSIFLIEPFPDRMKVRLWYGPKQVKIAELDLVASITAKSLTEIRSGLGSKVPPEQFLFTLRHAYNRLTTSAGSTWVRISDILPEVAYLLQSKAFRNTPKRENYYSYLQQDLSYDLYRLRAGGSHKGLQLRTATLAKTKSKTDSLWIPGNDSIDGGEHCSEIRFTEDTK